jgi:serine protease AprX
MARARKRARRPRASAKRARKPSFTFADKRGVVAFEAALRPESKRSLFAPDAVVSPQTLAEFRPARGQAVYAGRILEKLGFTVRHVGTFSISGEGPAALWEKVFSTKVAERTQPISEAHRDVGEVRFVTHLPNTPFRLPRELAPLVDRIYPQLPPTFLESPLPPRVPYHHLRVPADVATVLRALPVQRRNVTGAGVLVAMPDTGFYKHPYYAWHGYNYEATLAPDAIRVDHDEVGHGTAEAANIFACAPGIDFVGVKMGPNPTLAFKTASDLAPSVMTNSWGYSIAAAPLPNFLKPLELAVVEAVRDRGIIVCFSAGNGHWGFPGQMPDVISVGGVFAHDTLANGDFDLEASSYASSFDSPLYPGRHVPDVCGLVGQPPHAIYVMLPVEPGDAIDVGLAGGAYPNADETAPNDGWAVISGTSAASPQIAGVVALLKQVQPGLSPDVAKAILRASARDVTVGHSAHGQPAGLGHDGATGAGLVDALAAYRLVRSIQVRNANALPPPR